ncbi:MAG: ATP-dependent protease ATPase subunit HslU [Clostridia bacterium]|nr:ATP-dependent protease ATPase subunit HslU [Clostridia bacterium]MBQ1942903.1 ATP-dependent protease ATPase subunit HslU [Clostridia bacterium]MBQ5802586.1 ATP-dependent protease ATPase subunit HslU [Clostridia bacterium]
MNLSPKQIVSELDKYIIGQDEAKKAVAIALRNRYRRSMLSDEERDEITPKNIILKGPTGVGKTEIARRLARLVKAPFVKVEATKFTEVGYVGRDVDSMIRDLVECAVRLEKEESYAEVSARATAIAEDRLVKLLYDAKKSEKGETPDDLFKAELLSDLRKGTYNKMTVEIDVPDMPKNMEVIPGMGTEINVGTIFGDFLPKKRKKRKVTVKEAITLIVAEESEKMIDSDAVNAKALKRAEQDGIIFIDEIDKIAAKNSHGGADVSREGVQRDILPIVEGSTVMTKYGPVKTDFILFIAAGAFHVAKVEDLIPELQGRFPILVELHSLTKDDFVKILTTPRNAITLQYAKLLSVDGIDLRFTEDAIAEIAAVSEELNLTKEDIGARRLHTVMEELLEEISFAADGAAGYSVTVDQNYVCAHLKRAVAGKNLTEYIL